MTAVIPRTHKPILPVSWTFTQEPGFISTSDNELSPPFLFSVCLLVLCFLDHLRTESGPGELWMRGGWRAQADRQRCGARPGAKWHFNTWHILRVWQFMLDKHDASDCRVDGDTRAKLTCEIKNREAKKKFLLMIKTKWFLSFVSQENTVIKIWFLTKTAMGPRLIVVCLCVCQHRWCLWGWCVWWSAMQPSNDSISWKKLQVAHHDVCPLNCWLMSLG